jgi:hypothetical protein
MIRVARATPSPIPNLPAALVNLHRLANRTNAANWERYRGHRERLTELALSGGGDALALLGAGNCNDVDLQVLTERYREVHLVDVDRDAVRGAKARQPSHVASSLVLHAPVDLSGFLGQLPALRVHHPTAGELTALSESSVTRVLTSLPVRFDTVVSTCLLTQLMHGCYCGLGATHPLLPVIGCAAAVVHLRSVVRLLCPGGTGILVTDVVSSETYPLDEQATREDGLVLLEYLDEVGNVFTGSAVSLVKRILTEDEFVAPLVESWRLVPPWLWQTGENLTLLVYGVIITRRR